MLFFICIIFEFYLIVAPLVKIIPQYIFSCSVLLPIELLWSVWYHELFLLCWHYFKFSAVLSVLSDFHPTLKYILIQCVNTGTSVNWLFPRDYKNIASLLFSPEIWRLKAIYPKIMVRECVLRSWNADVHFKFYNSVWNKLFEVYIHNFS